MLALILCLAVAPTARADEAAAKSQLKAMSDYMATQKVMSMSLDTSLEIVTKDKQKILLASSGTLALSRPDKLRASRHGGFSDVEIVFDGKTLTLLGKDANVYAQADAPGTVDQLIDALREKFQRPLPGADLLMSNSYDQLMSDVIDVKDLGSGVIGGIECDHFAFRKKEVDFQIWIAQGASPYPCRYIITSKLITGEPQYSVQVSNWKSGNDVTPDDFSFKNSTDAKKVDLKDVSDTDELPAMFRVGASQ